MSYNDSAAPESLTANHTCPPAQDGAVRALKPTLDSTMDHKPLHSNRLRSAGYDRREAVLEIAFANGSIRCYRHVPETVWRSLLAAPNPASFHEDRIEEEYSWVPGTRADNPDSKKQLDDLFGGPPAENS